jgi:hypothetical protein
MKTIAQQLNIKEFPFIIKDKNGNRIYYEDSRHWSKSEYDAYGNETYFENSNGDIVDNRPKSCEGKIVEVDGVKYELKEVKR